MEKDDKNIFARASKRVRWSDKGHFLHKLKIIKTKMIFFLRIQIILKDKKNGENEICN